MTQPLHTLIRRLESFAAVRPDEKLVIEGLPILLRTFAPGQDVVHDGQRPSYCALVLDGWSCRYKLLDQGRRQILSFHIAGDIPDLQSLHLGIMDHGLAAVTETKIALIPHPSLYDLTDRFPRLTAILWRATLVDSAMFREWMIGMGRRSAYQRTGHLFCELYLRQAAVGLAADFRCAMPLTQAELADALGVSPVHMNRTLQELRRDELIALRGNMLTINDWDKLVRLCEFDPTYLHLQQREPG